MLPSLQDVLAAVSRHVAPRLQQAASASESQVRAELRRVEAGLGALQAKVSRVEALLGVADHGAQAVRKDGVTQLLADVEQRWEQELKAVKRELHQTILAHNHNADVMADHKSAIDRIRTELEERGPPAQLERDGHVREQLDRLSRTLEQNRSQERDIEGLLRRSDALMQQFTALGVISPVAMGAVHPAMLQYGSPLPVHPGLANLVM